MNSVSVQSGRWSRRRLLISMAVVFALQAGLIFWLSGKSDATPRPATTSPVLRFDRFRPAALLELEDPTLFVLPNHETFSGRAWMQVPRQQFQSRDWTEPPRWLPLPVQQLGAAFMEFAERHAQSQFDPAVLPERRVAVPEFVPVAVAQPASTLRLEGPIVARQLLSDAILPSWAHPDILTNTVVQVVVDAHGNVISAVPLRPGSGLPKADQYACDFAKSARFNSIAPEGPDRSEAPQPRLTVGTMIFQWHTVPATNSPAPAE
jgi:hypothetical protein